MSDLECLRIQMQAITHLAKCSFDDFTLSVNEIGNAFQKMREGIEK